jgi:hypothetical protein
MFTVIRSIIDLFKWGRVIDERLERYTRPQEKKSSTLKVRVWWWQQRG